MSYDPGISGISGASDVFLNNPAASDALSYDSVSSKWVNSPVDKARVGLSNVDNVADANKPVSTATQTALDFKAPLASPTFTGTVTGISKSMVGLDQVDNVADANKPVSTAAQGALDLKAPLASPTFTGTVGGVTATMVGLGSVDNTSDASKPVSTATQTALDGKVTASGVPTLGFANSQDEIPTGAEVGSLWVIP
jgi:hypothetical protein